MRKKLASLLAITEKRGNLDMRSRSGIPV